MAQACLRSRDLRDSEFAAVIYGRVRGVLPFCGFDMGDWFDSSLEIFLSFLFLGRG